MAGKQRAMPPSRDEESPHDTIYKMPEAGAPSPGAASICGKGNHHIRADKIKIRDMGLTWPEKENTFSAN